MIRGDAGGRVPFLSLRNAWECLLGGLLVFAVSLAALKFYAVAGTKAVPLWPSSGLALALLLLMGWRLFPSITVGTISATTLLGFNHYFSIAGAFGNTLESLTGWFLLIRILGFSSSMSRLRDLVHLMLAGATLGPLLNALICAGALELTGWVAFGGMPLSILLFWTGNFLGIVVFTPFVLRISQRYQNGSLFKVTASGIFWMIALALIVCSAFLIEKTAHTGLIPIAYISFPLLIWLSFSWRRDVTGPLALVTSLMTAFTVTGHGPLLRTQPMATYAEMTLFIAIYSISCLVLMAAQEELSFQSKLVLEHRISSERKEAELRNIRTTLNPHFLFNSLNTIKSLIIEDSTKARLALVGLSDLLRSSLRMTRSEFVPLREELSIIRSYLELQKIRHEERLDWRIEAEPSCEGIPVPPMLLHQLVENAIKHGVEGSQERSSILIRTTSRGESILMTVENTGVLPEHYNEGIGLQSIREELDVIYGNRASFSLLSTKEGHVVAEMILPKEAPSAEVSVT